MKNIKNLLSALLIIIALSACNPHITVDYVTKCNYYINNTTQTDYIAEFTIHPLFGQDSTTYSVTLKADETTLVKKESLMGAGHWTPDVYFNYLLIKTENGDTIIYENPIIVDDSWFVEKTDISKDGALWNEIWTYSIE